MKSLGKVLKERKKLPVSTKLAVLTEAGFRCAVPTCRTPLTLDLHHMEEFSAGGKDDPTNLVALCPNCHRMHHQGIIPADSIYAYKAMLIAIGRGFDISSIDRILFLNTLKKDALIVSGDGVLQFDLLIAAGLASFSEKANNNGLIVTYAINISRKGKLLVDAWESGNQVRLSQLLDQGLLAVGRTPTESTKNRKPKGS